MIGIWEVALATFPTVVLALLAIRMPEIPRGWYQA